MYTQTHTYAYISLRKDQANLSTSEINVLYVIPPTGIPTLTLWQGLHRHVILRAMLAVA
jgi:hypothetical protein